MRQHRGTHNGVSGAALVAALCLLTLGVLSRPARAQSAASNVARVSFVQGSVQLLAGQGSDFQQAVMNMPVVDGSRVQTGGDGEAEIEFGDGSVARLTPNSTVQFDHLGQDQVQLQQLSGLTYYELNVGDGHAPFDLQFANVDVQPTANSILRVGLDAGWEVAVVAGSVSLQGNGMAPANVGENQSARSGGDDNGGAYTVAQGINGDSWDNWNQDRDQAIAQEAALQTPVRDTSDNPQSENWNDLDADGNWYPVQGSGNVWVPAGVGADWDPYGAGYWGYYPTLGYTWISAYPWGWLPYHCGTWNYYSFGWGWSPGRGAGRTWAPVIPVRSHPPGWSMPMRPVPGGGIYPLPGQRLIAIDRGSAAKGPWAFQGSRPRPDHLQAVNFRGTALDPVQRVDVRPQGPSFVRGTSPGTRAALGGTFPGQGQRPSFGSAYTRAPNAPWPVQAPRPAQTVQVPQGGQPPYQPLPAPPARSEMQRPVGQNPEMQRPVQGNQQMQRPVGAGSQMQRPMGQNPEMQRPNGGYPAMQNYNQRSNYTPRPPTPTVHYSPPPQAQQPRFQAPPPPARGGAPGGGRR